MEKKKQLAEQAKAKPTAAHRRTDPAAKAFAATATKLEVLRDSLVDAASVGAALWFSYLFVLFYLGIAVGSVTHRDLLFESPVKLPFLNVDLPLVAFFALGPLIFLIAHAYVLLHFVFLAGKAGVFHTELDAQITDEETKSRLRRQLPSNIFVQFLAGPIEVRQGRLGLMLWFIAQITLLWGPLALLIFFLLQFLPYHHEPIVWWQRIAVVCDLTLLWALWPSVERGDASWISWRDLRHSKVVLAALGSLILIVLVSFIITFPGERRDDSWLARTFAWPRKILLEGDVDAVTQKPTSLWSNRLVLPGIDVIDHSKFDTEKKIKALPESLSLRGRSLEGAVFVGAGLRKIDFTGAQLRGATFDDADLRDVDFGCGEQHNCANLEHVSLVRARLPGAMLDYANLNDAVLAYAQLMGASLSYAKLHNADLFSAELEGANLESAELQSALLHFTYLQGASLAEANLEKVDIFRAFVWRADARNAKISSDQSILLEREKKYNYFSPSPNCNTVDCEWTTETSQVLTQYIRANVTKTAMQQGALDRITKTLDPVLVLTPEQKKALQEAEKTLQEAWNNLIPSSTSTEDHEDVLVHQITKSTCDGAKGLYAIRGLSRYFELRTVTQSDLVVWFADTLGGATNCRGARGLSKRDKDRLLRLRNLPKLAIPPDRTAPEGALAVAVRTDLLAPARQSLASNVGSPSVAVNGQVVFYTGNWYAAMSSDGGKNFKYIDPFTVFPDPPGFQFCCDQVVNYVPAIDTFVWLLSYNGTLTGYRSMQRLAFAKTVDAIAGKWKIYDITSQSLGLQEQALDFGDLVVGSNNVYVSMNIFTTNGVADGSAIVRIPFSGIAADRISPQVFASKDLMNFRIAQNCGATAFFAAHQDTSTLAVFSWDEAQQQPIKSLINIARWVGGNGYVSKGPDGSRWLDRVDARVIGATLAGNVLWFAWSADRDGKRPQPFVQIAKIDVRGMSLVENQYISDPDSAVAYPALATNADNDVAISYMVGGGNKFASHVVAILTGDPGKFVTLGGQGPLVNTTGRGEWGDYLTVRPVFPDRRLFAAAGYTIKKDAGNGRATPQLVIFGRPADVKLPADLRAPADVKVATDVKEAVSVPTFEMHPGVERWKVKTGTDSDAALVSPASTPKQIALEDLVNLPRPADMSPAAQSSTLYQDRRARPVETSVYSVDATIIAAKVEASGDYKLVLQGPSGETMIAAAPNPDDEFVAPNSIWKKEIIEVRRTLDAKKFPFANVSGIKVHIVGVGFFNRITGLSGGRSEERH